MANPDILTDPFEKMRTEGIRRSIEEASAVALGQLTVSPPLEETFKDAMPNIILGTS